MARMKRSVPTAAQYRRLKNDSLLLDLASPRQSTFTCITTGSWIVPAERGERWNDETFRRCLADAVGLSENFEPDDGPSYVQAART